MATASPPAMTAASASPVDAASSAARPARRRREDLEALAAEFVGAGQAPATAAARPSRAAVGLAAAGTAGLLAALAWLLWPADGPAQVRESATSPAGSEAWMQRLDAERERQRKEFERSHDFLQKMAAADRVLVDDMTSRADALTARSGARPAADAASPAPPVRTAEGAPEPSPRAEPAAAAAAPPAVVAPADGPPEPAPAPRAPAPVAAQQLASAAPAGPVPARDRAETDESAVAAPATCRIHVSELTGSGTLTYADVARMKGARTEPSTGHVFTPPIRVSGRSVVFVVAPDGCVRVRDALGG